MNFKEILEGKHTDQEVYDFVADHLRKQKYPATSLGGDLCRMRVEGRSCAIGCLVPDEEYTPGMEGKGVDSLLSQFYSAYGTRRRHLLRGLMSDVHDTWSADVAFAIDDVIESGIEIDTWEQAAESVSISARLEKILQRFCKKSKLTYTPPGDAK